MKSSDLLDTTSPGTPTFDQLRVLAAVVDAGSFSGAARRLNRAQSVVSYSIANLETQLGLKLFARGRNPALTEAGRAVLEDARRIGGLIDGLRARAAGLTSGLEAELSLAVDVMFPTARLVGVLDAFARQFPTVALRLRVEAMGMTTRLVLDRECRLGISGWMAGSFPELERRDLGTVALIPVASPCHPLAAIPPPISALQLHAHVQLVLTDRSRLTEGQDFGVLSPRTWRLGDLGAKHALLQAGLGWGNMPEPMVRGDLEAGRLRHLQIAEGGSRPFALLLINRTDTPLGPAGAWLAERLLAQ